jgi:hypothetical protein
MLDLLFTNFFGQGSSGGTNLSSGGTPEQLQGEDKTTIAQFSTIPARVSQQDIDNIARIAGESEASTVLMKTWSEQALTAQQAGLANLEVRINHAQQSMRNEQQYRKKIAKHGKNVLEHRIDVSATKSNLDGFQRVLNSASQNVSF